MSDGKTHLLVGTIVTVVILSAVYVYLKIFPMIIEMIVIPFVIYIYAQLPDLDSHSSTIKNVVMKYICGTFLLLSLVLVYNFYYPDDFINLKIIYYIFLSLGATSTAIEFMHHRGYMHNFVTGILLSLPWILLSPLISVACLVAFSTHLVMDGIKDG